MPQINLIIVLVAGVVKAVFDLVWRLKVSPSKKQTDHAHIESGDEQRRQWWQGPLSQIVLGIATAYALAYLIALTASYSARTLSELIFWVWLGFDAPALWSGVLGEKLARRVYFIEAGQRLASLLLAGTIVVLLTKLF
jgi:hypothetical protein